MNEPTGNEPGRLRPRLKQGAGASLPPFLAMEVVARANRRERMRGAGDPRVIRLEVGQPATGAPATAVAAAQRALAQGLPLGYTEALGLPSLRERIAAHCGTTYGVAVPPSRIVVTTGASGGFLLAFLAAFDSGDRIAMASPYYPPYNNILLALGMRPVVIQAGPDTRYQPSVALLEAMADTPEGLPDGLIVASPCNPAGTTLDAHELAALARFCDANGVRLVSDEIYHGLNWDGPPSTASAYSDSAMVINSFSKYWSMTGWRVGWAVLPEDLVAPVLRLKQNLFISAPHIAQVAAEAAFEGTDEIEATLGRLSPLARAPARHPAAGRATSAAAGAGRVLHLCRAARGNRRQRRVLRPAAAGRGDRRHPGRRFRCRARPPLRPLQLLRSGSGHGRGGAPPRRLPRCLTGSGRGPPRWWSAAAPRGSRRPRSWRRGPTSR